MAFLTYLWRLALGLHLALDVYLVKIDDGHSTGYLLGPAQSLKAHDDFIDSSNLYKFHHPQSIYLSLKYISYTFFQINIHINYSFLSLHHVFLPRYTLCLHPNWIGYQLPFHRNCFSISPTKEHR